MQRPTALFGLTGPFGLLALFASACGGAAPAAQAPAAPSSTSGAGDEAYASVDAAEQGLRRAEADLRSAIGGPSAGDVAGAPPRSAPAPAAEPAGPPPAREAQAEEAAPCATACRAFTSMTKAAETICRLAGAGDDRCAKAQRTVDDARSSLRTCVCVTAH